MLSSSVWSLDFERMAAGVSPYIMPHAALELIVVWFFVVTRFRQRQRRADTGACRKCRSPFHRTETRSGGNKLADDDVFFQSMQIVTFAFNGRASQHVDRMLE